MTLQKLIIRKPKKSSNAVEKKLLELDKKTVYDIASVQKVILKTTSEGHQ